MDFDGSALHLPDSKTGAKTVHIGAPALEILSKIVRLPDNSWIITGKLPGANLTDLQPPWQRIRKRAGIEDVRIHDLRHSFASGAVALGESLRGSASSSATPRSKRRPAMPTSPPIQ